MDTALLVVGILCALSAVNALAPRKGRLLLVPSFFASWLTIELAPWWLLWQAIALAVLVPTGGLESTRGWIGLGLVVASAAALVVVVVRARHTTLQVSAALRDLELDPDDRAPAFPRSKVVFPFLFRRWPGTTTTRNVVFGEGTTKKGKTVRLRLDVVRPAGAAPGDRRPGILQIHGGAWIFGDKREQGHPLLGHLATHGWVAINANYRLSPRVAAPEHLIDCKKAIAWWRRHAEEYGGDPDFLCVTGGSAGGHLTALVALTPNQARFQPGFEDVDTSVRAAVPFYGVYDFTNRFGTWHKDTVKRFFGPYVMQSRLEDEPEAWADYSPIDQVNADAPPFLVVHGSIDTLAPVEDAREFVERLRAVSGNPVLYAEMAGAQHAFEIFGSFRTARVIEGVERFLHAVWKGTLAPSAVADDLVEERLR
jgi:acetyl esterase/lipase